MAKYPPVSFRIPTDLMEAIAAHQKDTGAKNRNDTVVCLLRVGLEQFTKPVSAPKEVKSKSRAVVPAEAIRGVLQNMQVGREGATLKPAPRRSWRGLV